MFDLLPVASSHQVLEVTWPSCMSRTKRALAAELLNSDAC